MDDAHVSPKDGQIDFSKYSTEQLQELRHTIDGRSHPQNLRNILAELAGRDASGPERIAFRDLHEYPVRFSSRDGLAGWLQGLVARSPLHGSGFIRFQGAELALVGWQRNWMGVALETELRASMADICDVLVDDDSVSFDARFHDGKQRRVRCLVEDANQRQVIYDRLPANGLSLLSASAAEWREFDRDLNRITPHTWVTSTLICLNVAMFAAMLLSGSKLWTADLELLTRWGANSTPLTTDGESWRLISALFLHAGLLHLLLNMWTLWGIGRLTERLYGSAVFVAIYASGGVVASLNSIAWHPFVVSVGASGAIFSVLGACLAFFLRTRAHIPRRILWRYGLATLVFVVFNLASGLATKGTDNAAHVGGLLCGFILGALLARPMEDERRMPTPVRAATATGLVLLMMGCGFWQLHLMATDRSVPNQYWRQHPWFLQGQANAFRAHAELQAAAASGTLSATGFAARFEPQVFVFWRDAHEKLKAEPEPQDMALRDFAADVVEFTGRREAWAAALLKAAETENPTDFRDAAYQLTHADQAAARLNRHELKAISDPSHALSQSRLVGLLRRPFALLTWQCKGSDAGTLERSATDGPAGRRAAGCDAQRAFETEDFATLEEMLHPKDRKLVTFDDGSTRTEGAIAGFDALLQNVDAPGPTLSLLAKWRREFPLSDAPDLIEALLFRNWAWRARGEGYANTVSPQGWAAYRMRVEMADAALTDAADKPQHSPAFYPLAITVGLDRSTDRGQLRRHVDFSMEDFPEYYPTHRAMLRALLPRWGGTYEQIDDYVQQTLDKMPAEKRPEMYARLYTTVESVEGDEVDPFLDTFAEWPRVKAGYQDMLARYPRSDWLRNLYARMACRAKDAAAYRAVMSEIENAVAPEAWAGKYSVEKCNEEMKAAPEAT